MSLVSKIDDAFYPDVKTGWDDRAFRTFIIQRLNSDAIVLDLGAGAGIVCEMDFRGYAARICGVDPDPRVADNPHLDEGKIGTGESIPYESEAFDFVVADNVLEHLVDPVAVFTEVARVLKPNGRFLFKTPNKLHYMPTIASLTPFWFHQFYMKRVGRLEEDTFPTCYRANTPKTAIRHGRAAGLLPGKFHILEGRPEYLRLAAPLYLVGLAYERIVNSTSLLEPFRIVMMGELVKPS